MILSGVGREVGAAPDGEDAEEGGADEEEVDEGLAEPVHGGKREEGK